MIEISIIIPVYNSEKYISKCLDSIISQENSPFIEVILIDDGSTDRTPLIIKSYFKKYSFIKLISQSNQKQSVARNNGLKIASGKYVMFIDSDDYLESNMLSTMYEQMKVNQTDLCVCGIRKIYNNRHETEIKSCLQNSEDEIADYLVKHQEMDVGLWNKLFKLDIILENEIQFENGNFFEDTLFVFKYLCHVKQGITFIEIPLYNLLKREESTTTTYNKNIEIYAVKLLNKLESYLLEKQLERYLPLLIVLESRLLIHIIHHNLKFNTIDKNRKIKGILQQISIKTLLKLPIKYGISVLLLKLSPSIYEQLYLSKKGV